MQLRLDADLKAPGLARAFVQAHFNSTSHPNHSPLQVDVTLIVSELVTNAVQAGARNIIVQIESGGGRLNLQVTDDAEGWPELHHPEPDDVRGRGLSITTALADEWNTTKQGTQKVVSASWRTDPPRS